MERITTRGPHVKFITGTAAQIVQWEEQKIQLEKDQLVEARRHRLQIRRPSSSTSGHRRGGRRAQRGGGGVVGRLREILDGLSSSGDPGRLGAAYQRERVRELLLTLELAQILLRRSALGGAGEADHSVARGMEREISQMKLRCAALKRDQERRINKMKRAIVKQHEIARRKRADRSNSVGSATDDDDGDKPADADATAREFKIKELHVPFSLTNPVLKDGLRGAYNETGDFADCTLFINDTGAGRRRSPATCSVLYLKGADLRKGLMPVEMDWQSFAPKGGAALGLKVSLPLAKGCTRAMLTKLAAGCGSRITAIDLTSAQGVTPAGVLALARQCPRLEELNLSDCHLPRRQAEGGGTFPSAELCRALPARHLRVLQLAFNDGLTSIDPAIVHLLALETLNLRSCMLMEAPECLVGCKSLKTLKLSGNPFVKNSLKWKGMPVKILQKNTFYRLSALH